MELISANLSIYISYMILFIILCASATSPFKQFKYDTKPWLDVEYLCVSVFSNFHSCVVTQKYIKVNKEQSIGLHVPCGGPLTIKYQPPNSTCLNADKKHRCSPMILKNVFLSDLESNMCFEKSHAQVCQKGRKESDSSCSVPWTIGDMGRIAKKSETKTEVSPVTPVPVGSNLEDANKSWMTPTGIILCLFFVGFITLMYRRRNCRRQSVRTPSIDLKSLQRIPGEDVVYNSPRVPTRDLLRRESSSGNSSAEDDEIFGINYPSGVGDNRSTLSSERQSVSRRGSPAEAAAMNEIGDRPTDEVKARVDGNSAYEGIPMGPTQNPPPSALPVPVPVPVPVPMPVPGPEVVHVHMHVLPGLPEPPNVQLSVEESHSVYGMPMEADDEVGRDVDPQV